jgi:RNA polymerase sigma-70 factor (ECF subfamily)
MNLSRERFTAHVARVGASVADLDARGSDVYLALGCGLGDSAAMRYLTSTYFSSLERHLARAGFSPVDCQESLQQLLVHLCTGESPRILGFAGRASLLSWLRVAAMRHALDEVKRPHASPAQDNDELLSLIVDGGESPEHRVMVDGVQPVVQAALRDALGILSSRDRTLLHMFFREGMNIEAIGQIYGIHRATVARHLKDIRERVLAHVRAKVETTLGANPEDVDSLVFAVRSQIQLSLWHLAVSRQSSTVLPRAVPVPAARP